MIESWRAETDALKRKFQSLRILFSRRTDRPSVAADAAILLQEGAVVPAEYSNAKAIVAGAGISIPDGKTIINTGAFVPPLHASTHAAAGSDPVTLSESQITGLTADLASKLDDSQLGAASGVASLNGSTKVVEDPANATATPTASKIPIADGSGNLDRGWILGTFISRTIYASATSGTHTFSNKTKKVRVRGKGPGGGGAGVAGAASNAAAGGGGGSGGEFDVLLAVSPSDTATYNVPAGGAGGTAGANPGSAAASDTTFTYGATTYTGAKGNGGATAAAGTTAQINAGGGPGTATNGDWNSSGQPGGFGLVMSATVAKGGDGAPGWNGSGGSAGRTSTNGAGAPATGNGAGGSGARQVNNAANSAGGDGSPGLIIIDEYS